MITEMQLDAFIQQTPTAHRWDHQNDGSPWIRSTSSFWQSLENASQWRDRMHPPYRYAYPARVTPQMVLPLPIRPLCSNPKQAVASLISNQASLDVVDFIGREMGRLAQYFEVDRLLALPTLGMTFAPGVARHLGHQRWVPMGYSRKFWYDETLSTTVSSLTSPSLDKMIYLDPHQLTLLKGARVLIVDDVISSAQTVNQVWNLMESLNIDVVGVLVAMRQGEQWRETLGPARTMRVCGVFDTPRLELRQDGWWPIERVAV